MHNTQDNTQHTAAQLPPPAFLHAIWIADVKLWPIDIVQIVCLWAQKEINDILDKKQHWWPTFWPQNSLVFEGRTVSGFSHFKGLWQMAFATDVAGAP